MTDQQTEASPYVVDELPAAEYLVMEVLAARFRLGHPTWTFPTRLRRPLRSLQRKGLAGFQDGVAERTLTAWLTSAGYAGAMDPNYRPPTGAAEEERHWGVRYGTRVVTFGTSRLAAEQRVDTERRYAGAPQPVALVSRVARYGPWTDA